MYELVVVYSKQRRLVAGNAELGAGVGDAERLFCVSSAADFALGVDETTTRFRDDEAAASAFTSHSLSLLPLCNHLPEIVLLYVAFTAVSYN